MSTAGKSTPLPDLRALEDARPSNETLRVYRLGLPHDDLLLLIDQHVIDRLSLRIHTALGDGSRLAILRDLPFLYRELLAFQESDALCDVAVNASERDCLAGNRARPGLGPGILLAIVLSSVFDG